MPRFLFKHLSIGLYVSAIAMDHGYPFGEPVESM
jgi:hypothetical protein